MADNNSIKKLIQLTSGTCLFSEPLSRHTTFGIGGPADAIVFPSNITELQSILSFARVLKYPYYILGSGSNLLVSDKGIKGIVINLSKYFNKIKVNGTSIYAESGAILGKIVNKSVRNNLCGLESLSGIPGTVGGAVIMNAGSYGGEISDFLKNVTVITLNGVLKKYGLEDINFGYRSSSFKRDEIILSTEFTLKPGNEKKIKTKVRESKKSRLESQPLEYRSAGSVFKNPPGFSAGYLIDKTGLKGTISGSAEISQKHANFFINHGDAKAVDVIKLINLAKTMVKKEYDIDLELEIKLLGFDSKTVTT